MPNQNAELLLWYYIKVDEKYIGAVWLEQESTTSHAVLGVFIAYDEFRSFGYGTEAIKMILHNAAQVGISQVHLRVREQNTRAINCYRKIGFEIVKAIDKNGIPVFEMVYNK